MASRFLYITLSVCAVGIFVTGCTSFLPQLGTIGDRFQSNLNSLEKACAKRSGSRRRGDNSCDVVSVKPHSWEKTTSVKVEGQPVPVPMDWLATPEGQSAHSIVLPNPLSADSGYRSGMSSEEYFKHLCANEAGEFIFKTVKGVDGIYQARRRKLVTDNERYHLYALEDPAGSNIGQQIDYNVSGLSWLQWIGKDKYTYLENSDKTLLDITENPFFHNSTGPTFSRFFSDKDSTKKHIRHEFDSRLRSRYGYTWRGIRRDMDRELGIAGGELIAMDFAKNEILGVYRYYIRADATNDRLGIYWNHPCPQLLISNMRPLRSKTGFDFLSKVLQPPQVGEKTAD